MPAARKGVLQQPGSPLKGLFWEDDVFASPTLQSYKRSLLSPRGTSDSVPSTSHAFGQLMFPGTSQVCILQTLHKATILFSSLSVRKGTAHTGFRSLKDKT